MPEIVVPLFYSRSMITGAVDEAVALLRAGVDALLAVPVEGLEAVECVRVVEAVEVQRRRLEAVDQRLLAGASAAGVASLFGQPGLAGALASLLRIDVPEARRRVARAVDLGPRRALTGEPLPPILPLAAKAAAEGGEGGGGGGVGGRAAGCGHPVFGEDPGQRASRSLAGRGEGAGRGGQA